MLKLYENLIQSNNNTKKKLYKTPVTIVKSFPPSIRTWYNSIYTFDKNFLNLITDKRKITLNLIRSYFNLYNKKLEKKLRKSKLRFRFKRLSTNKIFISNSTFKHTNDKIIITINVYNRQKLNYLYIIKKKFFKFLTRNISFNLLFIRNKLKKYIRKEIINTKIVYNIFNDNNLYNPNIQKYIYNFYSKKLYKILIKKIIKKYKKHLLYKQLLFINKSKFSLDFLGFLNVCLYKLYKKNIEFNIVNLKNFYLNSDIFTEFVLLKIKKNRKTLVRSLNKIMMKSKIKKLNKYTIHTAPDNIYDIFINNNNWKLNSIYKYNKKLLKKVVLNLIKYKKVTGIRLEAQGRLTKRYTASRSLSKLRYKGNLRNIDSYYLKSPSVLLRGNLRSNLQYTKLSSKTRIGSFGLKGWVSGY